MLRVASICFAYASRQAWQVTTCRRRQRLHLLAPFPFFCITASVGRGGSNLYATHSLSVLAPANVCEVQQQHSSSFC